VSAGRVFQKTAVADDADLVPLEDAGTQSRNEHPYPRRHPENIAVLARLLPADITMRSIIRRGSDGWSRPIGPNLTSRSGP
jgi:hypothetical protein